MNNFTKLLLTFCFLISLDAVAQPFITKWDLSILGSGATQISFGVGTTGVVNYTWETIPAGTNGAGTFTGNFATITGLPAGATIRLSIDTTNFNRFKANGGLDAYRLTDVEQWGGVHWTTMQGTFFDCINLNITATDIPDLSIVTNMSSMFYLCTNLNSPTNINNWDVSNVTNMNNVFCQAANFNQPLGSWDISNVTTFNMMFYDAGSFNQPLNTWNPISALTMIAMFGNDSAFNQPIGNWNVSSVISFQGMFQGATSFNQPLNSWNIGNATNIQYMFENATSFNQYLGSWNIQNVTSLGALFHGASSYNQPLDTWNTQNITQMGGTFSGATSFNQPLNTWNTQNVTYMGSMFANATLFNQPLNTWNTQNVTNMSSMFYGATSFNQPLNSWNTQNVSDMSYMFNGATLFNQPLSNWNTQFVLNMRNMFSGAILFNQSIGNWNTGYSGNMRNMFSGATSFNQPLGSWSLNQVVILIGIFDSSGIDCVNYSSTLNGWSNNVNLPSNKSLGAANMKYKLNAITARNYLINVKGWTILGDALDNSNCCVTQQTTSNIATCNSYPFNGQVYTASGTYLDTLVSANGCDSIVTLNLTILQPTFNTINETACSSYLFNGQSLTSSGMYYDTLVNANGCDSILSLNLTINQTNVTVFQAGAYLYTSGSGASYQWLRCNPYQEIAGETGSSYTAAANGDYALVVTQNGCTDTSACVTVMGIGLDEYSNDDKIIIYPNPAQDRIYVTSTLSDNQNAKKELYNTLGQILLTTYENEIDVRALVKGVYYVRCGQLVEKLIVE
jgi:surface protein